MTARRIDVHHHAILPGIAELMREVGAPFKIPWSLAGTERLMAANGIGAALISNAIPGDFFTDAATAARFNRAANECVAQFAADRRDTFGLLAGLPMPHVDAALEEVAYAYEELKADGVVLIPHAGRAYLGDALYEPLLEELNRRAAVVLVHPMALPDTAPMNVPYVLADFLLDTTRGGLSLILSGALEKYPDIRFILSHGGGFLPYAADRVRWLGPAFFGHDPKRIAEGLHRLYYDTALTGPNALPSLLKAVPPQRILFGTDWCAAPADAVTDCVRGLDAAPLTEDQRRLIDRENALALFPRFAGTGAGAGTRAGAGAATAAPVS
ncbi:amidohydrolase family protein [Streptomyces sp. MST-110588]|uniref:amidohydrolase family protein n=1 Tax=Streptomyces sp. MST-110588 TaxID=2833628 RepID=UPI001F5D178B|nr:amidohydrolase family protein [Streptomyces sp. MST-110588]UNO40767.1 amidohydrolase [Streptomyces sp. MST-110588]